MSTDTGLTILSEEEYDEFSKQTYPFENLVFNGGGALCIAEIGFLQVLDDLGLRSGKQPQIQRYAGNSGGALVAGLAAVGYTGQELHDLVNVTNFKWLVKGWGGMWYNIFGKILSYAEFFNRYGLYTAERLELFFEQKIKDKIGNGKITFKQLYDEKKIELALTSVDVVREECVFFHPKTQPDVPIATAMRMSMSIPVIFTPMKKPNDQYGIFVDGGVLCNYPIMCYDGWYLSMARDHGFLEEFNEERKAIDNQHDRRFLDYNDKTLGVMVYNAYEQDVLTAELDDRTDYSIIRRPSTNLARQRQDGVDIINKSKKDQLDMSAAMDRLVNVVSVSTLKDSRITLEELQQYRRPMGASNYVESRESSGQVQMLLESVNTLTMTLIQSIPDLQASISTLRGIQQEPIRFIRSQNTVRSDTRHTSDYMQDYLDRVADLSSSLEEARHTAMTRISPPPKEMLAILLLLSIRNTSEQEYPVLEQTFDIFHHSVNDMRRDISLIFGSFPNMEDLFQNTPTENVITFVDIENMAENKAKDILETIQRTLGPVADMQSNSLLSYLGSCTNTMTTRITRGMMTEEDKKRTVGINTDYIRALDFDLEKDDKEFIMERGKQATIDYLRWYNTHQ